MDKEKREVKLNISLSSLLQTSAAKQLVFLIGVTASVTLGIFLYMKIQEPLYRPLDYQVNQKNMNVIVDTLEKAGIQYKINEKDGIVLVPANDLQSAKLKLAATGIAKDDSFNFSYLNDQSSIGSSQFLENARYLRALENDLAKTISSIEGVTGAKVHIATPQNNVFADENNRSTASVFINVNARFTGDKEKIRSIMQIMADSVPGLDPKDVAITDQYGHFLSESLTADNVYSAAQLNYQNSIQTYYEKRIQSMILPMVGENKSTVKVNAIVDFTQQEDAQEEYDPDKKVLRSEQSMNETTEGGGAGGPPGALSNSPQGEESAPAQSSASGNQGRNQSTKNYEVTKSVSYKKTNSAKIKSLSVAVVIDDESVMDPATKKYVTKPIEQAKLNKIIELVKATIGFDETRGDKVAVVNSSYSVPKVEEPVPPLRIWEQSWFWDDIKKAVGIVVGFVFLVILYRRLSKQLSGKLSSGGSGGGASPGLDNDMVNQIAQLQDFKNDGMSKLKQLATTEPNKVALVIKDWVGKQ